MEQKDLPEHTRRTQGQGGGVTGEGGGSLESQDRGEDAAFLGAGRPALPSRGQDSEAEG